MNSERTPSYVSYNWESTILTVLKTLAENTDGACHYDIKVRLGIFQVQKREWRYISILQNRIVYAILNAERVANNGTLFQGRTDRDISYWLC